MNSVRKSPMRTCVACRGVTDKRDLVRIVHTPAGLVAVDPSGKSNGRGAYVHLTQECLDDAIRRNRLAPALRTQLKEDDMDRLRQEFAAVIGGRETQ